MKILAEEEKVKDEVSRMFMDLQTCGRLVHLALYWLQIVEATANEASQAEQTVTDTMTSQSQGRSCLQPPAVSFQKS